MKTTIAWIVAVIVVAGAGYYIWSGMQTPSAQKGATAGTYTYQCDSGVKFTMTPSADVSSVTIKPIGAAPFGEVTLGKVGDANVFMSNPNDAEFQLSGKGETITIALGAQTLVCNPVPDQNNAPFNWGD